jgi:hypothetical protein
MQCHVSVQSLTELDWHLTLLLLQLNTLLMYTTESSSAGLPAAGQCTAAYQQGRRCKQLSYIPLLLTYNVCLFCAYCDVDVHIRCVQLLYLRRLLSLALRACNCSDASLCNVAHTMHTDSDTQYVHAVEQSSRLIARAVLRLLLRSDSRTPVLLLEDMYYASGADTAAAAHITEQAQFISDALGVPYCTKDSVLGRCANSEHSAQLDRYGMLSL